MIFNLLLLFTKTPVSRFSAVIILAVMSLCHSGFSQGFSKAQKDSILNAYVTVPNSDIRIVPPAYFKAFVNDGKFGFMHDGSGASVSIQEIIGTPYPIVAQYMSKEYLETQGVKFITKEDIQTRDKKDAIIYLVSFPVKSKDGTKELQYERLMLFTGDYNRTIWISANYPVVARKMLFVALRESLLSVKFD